MPNAYSKVRTNKRHWRQFRVESGWNISPTTLASAGVLEDLSYVSSGTILPGYKEIIKRGGDATTPWSLVAWDVGGSLEYQVSVSTYSGGNKNFWHATSDHGIQGFNTSLYQGSVPASVSSSVRNHCLRRFYDSANNVRSSFEAGQDLIEWKEAVHMIASPLKSLRNLTRDYVLGAKKLLKANRRDIHKAAKQIGDSWLEYRFGWRPLALDVKSACKDLFDRYQPNNIVVVKEQASDTFSATDSTIGVYSYGTGSISQTRRSHGSYGYRITAGVRTGSVGDTQPLLQRLQLDLPHFVPTVWDIIPYSWLVDYFVNVGDIVQALSFRRSDLAWISVGTREQYFTTFGPFVFSPAVGHTVVTNSCSGGDATFVKTVVNRYNTAPDSLIPSVEFSLPLSDKPWANIAALLTHWLD